MLRDTLRLHRHELQSAVQWMSDRLGRLAGDAAELGAGTLIGQADPDLVDALTPREREVLRLLARGKTKLAIAQLLVVREGTINTTSRTSCESWGRPVAPTRCHATCARPMDRAGR